MNTILDTMKNLYSNKNDDADLTFVVHGELVKAHKCVINGQSDVLKAMIFHGLVDDDGRHIINDKEVTAADFKNFLKFLYLRQCDINEGNLKTLLHMSNMYMVPSLKAKCMEFVRGQCSSKDGLLQYCELAILYEEEAPEMVSLCFNRLCNKNFDNFNYTSATGVNRASPELIRRIAKDCPRTEYLTEENLLLKIFEWGKNECKQRGILPVNPNGMKMVLAPIMKEMKLENATLHSWANIIHPNGLVSPQKCLEVFTAFAKRSSGEAVKITPKMLKDGHIPPRMNVAYNHHHGFGGYRNPVNANYGGNGYREFFESAGMDIYDLGLDFDEDDE